MLNSLKDDYTAVVLGATGGIGRAMTAHLENDPRCANVIGLSRRSAPPIDLNDESSLEDAATKIKNDHGEIDALIIATGVLTAPDGSGPEKAFSHLEQVSSAALFQINAIGPALALKHFMPLLARKRRVITATLSARVGSIGDNGLGGWISYRASKAALNQITHTAAIELSRKNKDSLCVALHPGTIETNLSRSLASGRFTHTADQCAVNLFNVLDKLSADQTGGFYDYDGKEIVW